MPREAHRRPAARARTLPAGAGGPYWRALLEARWRARLQEVTELSLAYHSAEALAPHGGGDGQPGPRELRMLFAARLRPAGNWRRSKKPWAG